MENFAARGLVLSASSQRDRTNPSLDLLRLSGGRPKREGQTIPCSKSGFLISSFANLEFVATISASENFINFREPNAPVVQPQDQTSPNIAVTGVLRANFVARE
jgi:hypothetical protein